MNVSPEEYRKRKLAVQRQTVRTVRNSLIMLAVLAGVWYIYLVCEARRARNAEMPPPAGPTISSADKTAAPDDSFSTESDVQSNSSEKKSNTPKESTDSIKQNESAKSKEPVKPVEKLLPPGQTGEVKPGSTSSGEKK